jgi:FMN phosphatase YigB (HAD superfamily)
MAASASPATRTDRAERLLKALNLPASFFGPSPGGVEKPSPGFFERIATECGMAAGDVPYVGDRVDNDVLPALAAGVVAVFLRRGPWDYIHAAGHRRRGRMSDRFVGGTARPADAAKAVAQMAAETCRWP